MKIVVLAGGLSPERDVSLSSGSLIANALISQGYDVAMADVYLGIGQDLTEREMEAMFVNSRSGDHFTYQIPPDAPDLEEIKRKSGNRGNEMIGPGILKLCRFCDLVFLALHGSIGENGQLQALFDLYDIPYTGSGYESSMLAMNKNLSKQLMREKKIHTADWLILDLDRPLQWLEEQIRDGVRYPCVVKPCSCGSSVGVTILEQENRLEAAVAAAKQYGKLVLVEKKIEGREFAVGILDGKALPVIEIIPKTGFYDYTNKYQPGQTVEICPAYIDRAVCSKMQEAALTLHQALSLGFYSRIDFIFGREAGKDGVEKIYCLEANNLPGMTPASLLPQEAMAAGISYKTLCKMIAEDAVRKPHFIK